MASEHEPKPPQGEIILSAPLHSDMSSVYHLIQDGDRISANIVADQPENHHAVMRPSQIVNNDTFLSESGSKSGALRSISYTPPITRSKSKLLGVEQSLPLSKNARQRQSSIKNQKRKARAQPITTTFHYFICFPIEIRLEIFRHMFPHPRTISTSNQHYSTRDSSQIELLKPAVTFYINHEARQETLRFWVVDKAFNHTPGAFDEMSFRPNYDQFQLNVYLWNSESYIQSMRRFEEKNPGCLSAVKEITLVASKPGYMPIFNLKLHDRPNIFQHLPKLERVFIRCVIFKPQLILKFWPSLHKFWMQKVWKQAWGSKEKVPDISYLAI
ncbi:ef054247-0ec0-4bc0-9235-0bee63ec2960 [Sclerotinia trifoliorum]|uniref:Ef054247-0ec0-4bc0-9235-0bee63ec2960 n=1 Tax=Sclerotinia trifoliorum TaxID=28548 RepID=A0A8H2VVJ3_9HELO|nr:ef054247-0ec0-4bc0-9235-0bee63ec2960 [Sclerotinia trifoliorum]